MIADLAKTRSKWQRFPMLLLGLVLVGCLAPSALGSRHGRE